MLNNRSIVFFSMKSSRITLNFSWRMFVRRDSKMGFSEQILAIVGDFPTSPGMHNVSLGIMWSADFSVVLVFVLYASTSTSIEARSSCETRLVRMILPSRLMTWRMSSIGASDEKEVIGEVGLYKDVNRTGP